ncbi:MAG: L,D-transpeptidase family protein [Prevotella sp.]|jgi:murein L,D-transpeptidase YcbB/YkuD|nr:L,D-transpeptidase family protein [Prevotella sp.]
MELSIVKLFRFFLLVICLLGSLTACNNKLANPNTQLSLHSYSELRSDTLTLSPSRVRAEIDSCIAHDEDSLTTDYRIRQYYLNRGDFIWIDRKGVDARADTVLSWLKTVKDMGFSLKKFHVRQIERDLHRIRSLQFDHVNNINVVMGRLEYNLSKGFFRYAVGQRFGFMNPDYVFNHLEPSEESSSDSQAVTNYLQLFALPMEHATKAFYQLSLRKVKQDSISEFLRAVQPKSPFYNRLLALLKTAQGRRERNLILCNMERCRWRLKDYPQRHRKYVVVNIPSFALHAVDGTSDLVMRVGCGTSVTKTPLLMSAVKRMDINPQWIVPKSIIKKSIVQHAGDKAYFQNKRFFILERSSGETVDPRRTTRAMLLSPDYAVIQEGGKGNSLGRIIFRFNNDFSIYLHDTSSKEFFSQENRGVSHGCVRVQKPFKLAVFLLGKKDPHLIERIRYSMSADISSVQHHLYDGQDQKEDGEDEGKDDLNHHLLLNTVSVRPPVPIYIIYYTLYPGKDGQLKRYDDIYSYDRVILHFLRNYQ